MTGQRAADILVACLEAEGVRHVFGVPGEETLDLNHALQHSSIAFVPVRHEQGAAYMADMVGRLTGRAGVCLATLGPGALNLVTAVADAQLEHAPLVALSGQRALATMHKESHQVVDLVEVMRPITKWSARVADPQVVPEVVRKAFAVAEAHKPGAVHLELPEDVMAAPLQAAPLARRVTPLPEPPARELARAAQLVCEARRPVVLAGNGVLRAGAAPALRAFAHATRIGIAETFMGKGAIDCDDPLALGTVGAHDRDAELAGISGADLVIAVGYDLAEQAPAQWNPHRDKTIVVIDTAPAEIDAHFLAEVQLVGDVGAVLARLTQACRKRPAARAERVPSRLRDAVLARLEAARDDDGFPVAPPRALWELRRALGPQDMLVSDVGLHKLWIARMFGAHEPNTVFISNGLAGMGCALPRAIAAKLVAPRRNVVAICGDGGLLMNVQELETAVRLRTALTCVVWEDGRFGSIAALQRARFGETFGVDFANPDFVKLAESFGMPAWRCAAADDFGRRLRHALTLDVPSLIVLPIDYTLDVAISDELGEETVVRT
ncbi:MAG TPA: acetolactate synthase large subunit [Solirubrobacteraceae bacterium]|jgi:acetolactate synthase-1/2/3 large subunit|nr:acetolactate synthase large subunit [Solirubrobacteraceae bacterium]